MDLRGLRHFVAIARARSVARAAKLLRLSPAELNREVRELERELGFALFDHVYDQVALTPSGEEFLPAAEKLLAHADEVSGFAARLRSEGSTDHSE